jgi:hypothetical protein
MPKGSCRPFSCFKTDRRTFSASGYKVCREFNLRRPVIKLPSAAAHLDRQDCNIAAVTGVLLLLILAFSIWTALSSSGLPNYKPTELVSATESLLNELIFISFALFFLVNLEGRLKRKSALKSIHMLRSLAHVIDMHQLTKDPVMVLPAPGCKHGSPIDEPVGDPYLDYCTGVVLM